MYFVLHIFSSLLRFVLGLLLLFFLFLFLFAFFLRRLSLRLRLRSCLRNFFLSRRLNLELLRSRLRIKWLLFEAMGSSFLHALSSPPLHFRSCLLRLFSIRLVLLEEPVRLSVTLCRCLRVLGFALRLFRDSSSCEGKNLKRLEANFLCSRSCLRFVSEGASASKKDLKHANTYNKFLSFLKQILD